jgi:serine/threonine protein kinase/Tfp pilus assembly protein PilF
LVEELTNRIQAGESIDLEDYARRNPEYADSIRQLLPALEVLADLGRSAVRGAVRGLPADLESADGDGVLGDFRIIREVGRGGMGVVYEARQVSLGRRVALKVLPFAAALDPRQLQRFKVEAQAAALLHHTHIVPVFSVGVERGVHYYAMQFIDGRSLAEVIRELRRFHGLTPKDHEPAGSAWSTINLAAALASGEPGAAAPPPGEAAPRPSIAKQPAAIEPDSPAPALSSGTSITGRAFFQAAARLGIQAAEALEYAHSLGVVHRDVKPANLLLDARGNLWVTDFGLAQVQAEGGLTLTLTGDVLGTLRYMSPEQALGRRALVDHRCDIYSLGVTLYELLTLHPAVEGSDRQEILRRIAFEESAELRRHNPAVPRELETIVLKAMAKEPEGRYTTAQELADDLARYLDHRPILARRPSPLERAGKWARRHRAAVATAVAVLLVAVIGLTTALVVIARERDEAREQRRVAEQTAREVERLRRAEEARAREARQAVDTMYTRVAERWLADRPRLEPVQRDLLEEALRFYENFAREEGTDPSIRLESARAHLRVAEIRSKFGNHREAEVAYRRCIELAGRLAADSPAEAGPRLLLAKCWNGLGGLLLITGRPAEAGTACRRGVEAAEGLDRSPHAPTESLEIRASLHRNLGLQLAGADRRAEAEAEYRCALQLYERLGERDPASERYRRGLAYARNSLGNLFDDGVRTAEAESEYRRALEALEPLVRGPSAPPEDRNLLAMVSINLGTLLWTAHHSPETEGLIRGSLATWEGLTAEFPSVRVYREHRNNAWSTLATLLKTSGRTREAEEAYRQSIDGLEALAAQHPGVVKHRMILAACLNNLGNLLVNEGRYEEAGVSHRRALELRQRLADQQPDNPELRGPLADSFRAIGDVHWKLGRPRDTEVAYRRALEIHESLGASGPAAARYRLMAADELSNLAAVHQTTGRPADAERAYRRALEITESLPEGITRRAEFREKFAGLHQKLGWFLSRNGRVSEAVEAYGRAVEAAEAALAGLPGNDRLKGVLAEHLNRLAWTLATEPAALDPARSVTLTERAVALAPDKGAYQNTLGVARYRAGDWSGAIEASQKSMALRSGGDASDWLVLAMAHWRRGEKQPAREWHDKAIKWLDKNTPNDRDLRRIRDEAAALLGGGGATMPNGRQAFAPER